MHLSIKTLHVHCRCGGLIHVVNALVFRQRNPVSSPCRDPCVVFLDKALYSHSASLHPARSINGYNELSEQCHNCKMLGGNLRWTSISFRRSSNTPSHFLLEISADLLSTRLLKKGARDTFHPINCMCIHESILNKHLSAKFT